MTLAKDLFDQDQMMQLLGASIIRQVEGCVELEMMVTERMVQKHGTCQGGALFTLADAAFGISANCAGREAVSQHCSITYLRPAHLGEVVVASVSLRTTVGRTSIYDVSLSTEAGGLVAEFRGVARALSK
ncbi:hotdog fold thioesterase [Lentibacter algarum]|jgi:acyl-CoA thioesterase|uniref:hotdog fold thioesterase n=1 Tax=Lentibacter algarum TaxID=576131 RepID=UPI0024E0C61B|nr:hotdog fold thioesterase [Lentibacter algarum]